MEIIVNNEKRHIIFNKMSALEAWHIKENFKVFANSNDFEYRFKYIMNVIGKVKVLIGGNEINLSTRAIIDNHVSTKENIFKVFDGQLKFNGIMQEDCANEIDYFTNAINEMSTSFVSKCSESVDSIVKIALRINKNE